MTSYLFHPEAALDLEEIWDFVAQHSHDAADRVLSEIMDALSLD